MKKSITIGTIITLVGAIVFTCAFAASGWDITKMSTGASYIEKEYISDKAFDLITIDDSTSNIIFDRSKDEKIHIKYSESADEHYNITETTSLNFTKESIAPWYNRIFKIDFNQHAMTVFLPEKLISNIEAITRNGKITISGINANNVSITTSNGSAEIKDVDFSENANIDITTHNGDTILSDVKANNIKISSDNGHIEMNDAEFIDTCSLSSYNGNIRGILEGHITDYSISSSTYNGQNTLPETQNMGGKKLIVKTHNGNIRLNFSDD